MITTTATRRAVTILQAMVTLEEALTPDQCAQGREAVEAARLELERIDVELDARAIPADVIHVHAPRPTEVDVDVAITTTGRTLAVKVGRAAHEGESDEAAVDKAVELSKRASDAAVKCYSEAGWSFGKIEAGSR